MRPETLTLVLVNMAAIMERADEALLPGVYKEVGAAMHIDPTGLGSLTLVRSIVQSSCYPLAAYLAIRHNRAHVIALGALLWAAATFLVAISSTFFQMAISRGLNGIGLAIVVPAIQSLVADSTDDKNRGMAFGWLQLTGNFGTILGGMFAVLLASTSFMGVAGWRIAFHLIGLMSAVVGVLVRVFANDPRFPDSVNRAEKQTAHDSFSSDLKGLFNEAKSVTKILSFQIIVAQGVAGSFAWASMAFTTMWLELIGFSHEQTAFLTTTFAVAVSLGGLFGGRMGDILAQRFPNAGRVALAQISSGLAIPLATVWLLGLPHTPSPFLYGLVMFIMGFCISWNAPATNNPIFAEIVPEKSRTSIYALDRCFESILSSFAPPVVGILAQQFYGYQPIQRGVSDSLEIETDRGNADSLAKAMYTSISITKVVGFIIYSFLHRTYPHDRERARMQAIRESEMKMLALDTPLMEDHSLIHVSESGMQYILNTNDERYLLLNRKRKSEQ